MTLVICTRRRSDDFRFVVGRATADIDSALNRTTNLGPRTTNLHISSKKTAGQRSDLLREFVVHKRALMTNARCLTEGVEITPSDRAAMPGGSTSRSRRSAEAITDSPLSRQASTRRAAVLSVSPNNAISFLTDPISPTTPM